MKPRRAVIFLIAILAIGIMRVAYAQTPNKPPASDWQFDYRVQLLAGIAALLVGGAGVLLFFAAKKPGDSFIFKMRPSFFFWLGITYTMLLMLVAVAYSLAYTGTQPYLLGKMLPIAVPWFGALGAVTISLEGVFKWSESRWNPEYNYWHIGRPLFGAVLGTIGFFLFVLIISTAGTSPKFLDNSGDATPAKDFIIYYVVAFLAGYREETFRELIRRVTDMILKPAAQSGAAPQITFRYDGIAQAEIRVPETTVGQTAKKTIEVVNSSSVSVIKPMLTLREADSSSKDVFGLANDHVTGVNEFGAGQTGTVDITFTPLTPGAYVGVLSIAATNLEPPATIRVAGSAV